MDDGTHSILRRQFTWMGERRVDIINPYWAAAAAVLLYLSTVDLLGRIHKGQPTNGSVVIGGLLTGYVVFSLIVLCGP